MSDKQVDNSKQLPTVIGIRTAEFAPILEKWRAENKGVPWSELLRRALCGYSEMQRLAGKRHAHLLEN